MTSSQSSATIRASGSAAEEEQDGTYTPSMQEIEEEYGRVEERSKNGNKLSRITANLEHWMRQR
jgi:hypothetical protein